MVAEEVQKAHLVASAAPPRRRASEVLLAVAAAPGGDTVTVEEIAAAFDTRAYGPFLILLGLVNCIPFPPGLLSIIGLPIVILGVQMLLGRRTPWLPHSVMRRRIKRDDLTRHATAAQPILQRIERLLRPRMAGVFRILPQRAIGLLVTIFGTCVLIPIPLTNFVPSLGTVIVALALIEADGLVLALGVLVGIVGVSISAVVTGSIVVALGAVTF